MAEPRKARGASATGGREGDLLEDFLGAFDTFVSQVSEMATEAAPEGEQKILLQLTGESFVGQTTKMTGLAREMAGRLSSAQRVELDRFLQVQDGVALANRGVDGMRRLLRGGVLGRLVHWISRNLEELKKLLQMIIQFILMLLHLPYPDWMDTIFRIIDELWHLIGSLLNEVFGLDFALTARQLSEQHVDYLRESAAFESMRRARTGGRADFPDET
jgi:hypothetical protein